MTRSSPVGGDGRIVVATGNPHKLDEIGRILEGLPVVLVAMTELGVEPPVEDGATFEENALIKARACVASTGLAAIADDSGLAVDALDGEPGVRSARYAGEDADDAANNARLVVELSRRGGAGPWRARFVCAAALVLPDGTERVVHGGMEGQVVVEPRGANGFGYDPHFVSDAAGDGRTNGELTAAEKDALSHRGAAFRGLRRVLAELTG